MPLRAVVSGPQRSISRKEWSAMAYDPNRNYAAEIAEAVKGGASQETVAQLNAARNEKIAANQSHYSGKGISSTDRYGQSADLYSNGLSPYSGGSGGGEAPRQDKGSTVPSTDLSEYLKQLYAAQTEASIAQLESAYKQNTADLSAQKEKIAPLYQTARNETASQSDLAQQQFNEYAAARGLGTGSGGQATLAAAAALQSNLNTLSTNEANAVSANELEAQKLSIAYNDAITNAKASGNAALAQALYQEYVRQTDQSMANAQLQMQQDQWDKTYQMQLSQNNQSATEISRKYAYDMASAMLQNGILPDSATLTSAGISSADAQAMVSQYQALAAQQTVAQTPKAKSGGGKPKKPQQEEITSVYKETTGDYRNQNVGHSFSSGEYQRFLYEIGMTRGSQGRVALIRDAVDEGKITEAQAKSLLAQFKIQ